MSWVEFVWSMVISGCLTLAVVHGMAWWRHREARAYGLFSLAAAGTAVLAGTELWMMHTETAGQMALALRWFFAAAWLVNVSLVAFVRSHLRAGRRWLARTVYATWTLALVINFVHPPNLGYQVITGVRRIPFLGEPVSVAVGVPSRWMLFGQFGLLLVVIFAVDASLTVWRRGDRGRATLLCGSIVFFTLMGSAQATLTFWPFISLPATPSVFFQATVIAMSYLLIYDMLHAAETGRALEVSQRQLIQSRREAETLSGRLIAARDDERARLAREMHDGLSQSLALLAVEMELLGQQPSAAPEPMKDRVDELASRVKAIGADVHRIAHGLHPAKLDQLGLAAATSGHCRDVSRSHAIAIHCECRDVSRWVPPDVALCLYHVVQEALHNVVKHSGATNATVEMTATGGELRLSISDNGKGFDPGEALTGEGLGLLSLRERVRLVHGRIEWRSQPAAGTRVDVRVPLPPAGASG